MEERWIEIKEKYKAPAVVAVGWYAVISLILYTFDVPYFTKVFSYLFVGIVPALMVAWAFIAIRGTIVDISDEINRFRR